MRIARTAATLGLVLVAAACGSSPTEPGGNHGRTLKPARQELVSPAASAPRMGGNLIGSGY